ncbi:hypothetical protein D3C72_2529880 [compost metagenome]
MRVARGLLRMTSGISRPLTARRRLDVAGAFARAVFCRKENMGLVLADSPVTRMKKPAHKVPADCTAD